MKLSLQEAGRPLLLGPKIAQGGEGIIYEVAGLPSHVAKWFLHSPEQNKVEKIRRMVSIKESDLVRVAAWPTDLVLDHAGAIRGFTMPRVHDHVDIHELYSTKSRISAFPSADFRFLVHVGTNIARAFALAHSKGIVIGDVNHGNVLVGAGGTVRLIDCDSFQIGVGAACNTCDVGTPLFLPPELQGQNLRGVVRTSDQDCFGLAVLLFHLLYLGRHPFAGRFAGSGEMPPERAISEYRFAYGPDRATTSMEPPPGTLPLQTMGEDIADLFVRAFSRPSHQLHGRRPASVDWIRVLQSLSQGLVSCDRDGSHAFPRRLSGCPWCRFERVTGLRLFGHPTVNAIDGMFESLDVDVIWRAIESTPEPPPDPALPSIRPWAPPVGVQVPSSTPRFARQVVSVWLLFLAVINLFSQIDEGLVAFLIFLAAAWLVWPSAARAEKAKAERDLAEAKSRWDQMLGQWRREASIERFGLTRSALASKREEANKLLGKIRRQAAANEAAVRSRQLDAYLDQFRIDDSRIPHVGSSRIAMLASYGIETAADVKYSDVVGVPGFGKFLAGKLIEWRVRLERNFRFDPNDPLLVTGAKGVDQGLQRLRRDLLLDLSQGPRQLNEVSREIELARGRLLPLLEAAWEEVKLAELRSNSL